MRCRFLRTPQVNSAVTTQPGSLNTFDSAPPIDLTLPDTFALGSFGSESRPLLSSSQAEVNVLIKDDRPPASVDATYRPALLSESLPLKLQGSHALLDSLFSGSTDVVLMTTLSIQMKLT